MFKVCVRLILVPGKTLISGYSGGRDSKTCPPGRGACHQGRGMRPVAQGSLVFGVHSRLKIHWYLLMSTWL